jgi:Spy/CpxP family protein refolding chaperone
MNDTIQSNGNKPKTRWRRAVFAMLIGGLLVGAGANIFAHGTPGFLGGGHCGFSRADPETATRRAEFMVRFMLSEINASEAQQAKIAAIVKAAMSDLRPLRDKHFEGHQAGAELLSKPGIDRAALESLRAEQMRLAETASRRIAQALADAFDVLTPEQRAALVERMQRMRGAHHS